MSIREEMDAAIARLDAARAERRETERGMRDIADRCKHAWQFKNQVNAFYKNLWNVTWKCSLCDSIRVDKDVPPICTKCHAQLIRADDPRDTEAETERTKPEHQGHYNPPEAWRCTACGKIHILYLCGD